MGQPRASSVDIEGIEAQAQDFRRLFGIYDEAEVVEESTTEWRARGGR